MANSSLNNLIDSTRDYINQIALKQTIKYIGSFDQFPTDSFPGDLVCVLGKPYMWTGDEWDPIADMETSKSAEVHKDNLIVYKDKLYCEYCGAPLIVRGKYSDIVKCQYCGQLNNLVKEIIS